MANKQRNTRSGSIKPDIQFKGDYLGSARSRQFDPVTAISMEKQEKVKADQRLQAEKNRAQALDRQQRLDASTLRNIQSFESAELKHEQAGATGKLNLLKGLAGLSTTAANAVGQLAEQQALREADRQNADAADSILNAGGTVVAPNDDGGLSVVPTGDGPSEVATGAADRATDQNLQVASIESGVTSATQDPELQEQLRAPSADQQAATNAGKVDVYQATVNVGSYIGDSMDSDRLVTLPDGRQIPANQARTRQELTAVAFAFAKEYARVNGLSSGSGAKDDAFVRSYVPAAQNAVAREVSSRAAAGRDATHNARITLANEAATAGLQAGESLSTTWDSLSKSYFGSGRFKGDRTKANAAAMDFLLGQLAADGNVEAIQELGDTPKFEGGPKLRTTYNEAISKAEDQARRVRRGDKSAAAAAAGDQLQDASNTFIENLTNAKTPEEVAAAHDTYEATLKSLQTPEARAEYLKQRGIPNNRNPLAYGDMVDRVAAGESLSQAEIDEAVGNGTISIEQGRQISTMNGVSQEDSTKALKPIQPVVKAVAKAAAVGQLQTQGVPSEAVQSAAVAISTDLTSRVNGYLTGLLKDDPNMTQGQLTEAAQRWMSTNAPNLLKTVTWDVDSYSVKGYTYAGTQSTSSASATTYTNPQTGQKGVVLTNLSVEQMTSLQFDNNLDNDIDPSTDRILKSDEMSESLKAIIAGDNDTIPTRVKAIARLLDVTPQYLIAQQAKAQGLPNAAKISKAVTYDPNRNFGSSGPQTKEEGMAYFQGRGFTRKGAAMLSANIQSESAWNGMRDWGQVAGDGTSRNGGLVSWAQWSNDPARLGTAERWIGKPINQATHAEQLEFMEYEMKTRYTNAYRIFRNPNATDAQLRRAAKEYWGWGIEGDRFSYYNELARG